MPSPEQTKWGGTNGKWGGTKNLLIKTTITATIMRNFKKRPAAFLSSFRLRTIIAWKIYLQQWMLPDVQLGFCLERWTKSKFFCTKTAYDLDPVLNKLMQLMRVTKVHSHQRFTDRGWRPGGKVPSRWAILRQKNSNFNAILIIFRTFWSRMNN